MSIGLPSDEVAEDYKSSLEDLVDNSRITINNLTVIAKENIEHASAISRVLENHIKSTQPNRKLPSLYLLDSIVKNVGTPYTLFLSRNLYATFMNAYTLVNTMIRQKLDEMLQTWKSPNPGSLETKPVFPSEVTRPIEEALQKARNAAFEQQQRQALRAQQEATIRGRPMAQINLNYRPAVTPPLVSGQYRPPLQSYPLTLAQQSVLGHPYQQMQANHVQGAAFPIAIPGASPPPAPHQPPNQYRKPPTPVDLPLLHRDIAELVGRGQAEVAAKPFDVSVKAHLEALTSLQALLQQRYHPPEQLQQVRDQVTGLQHAQKAPLISMDSTPPAYTTPIHQLSGPYQQTDSKALAQSQQILQPATPSPVDIQALMSSRNLANIIAEAQKNSSTPPSSFASLASLPSTESPSAAGASDLLASLTKAGLINGSLANVSPASAFATPATSSLAPTRNGLLLNDVQLTSASLKIPRLHLISLLYESQPAQCTTCGRRFPATEEGREKRSRHYDWHFRTNQRINEAAKRAQNRSWYVDELEWIKSRDDQEGNPVENMVESKDKAISPQNSQKAFVHVPADQTLANQPCPICQEKFVASYNDEVSDWVWMDAVQINEGRGATPRIYHASCYREVKRNQSRENTPARTDTPDSVLGKRKAIAPLSDLEPKLIKV